MIGRVAIRNFKSFKEQTFELEGSVVLAGPNNAGKSTLLQAIATWKFCLERWIAKQSGGEAAKRPGVAIPRSEITTVPLREMNLLWEDRKVTGPQGMSGARRMIEIVVEGRTNGEDWECGIEIQYANRELVHARPKGARELDKDAIRNFPPEAARKLDIVHVPPLSGIERDEPRRDRGMQDLLVGQGRPGEILRNLLLEIAESGDVERWRSLEKHVLELFGIKLIEPVYSPAQPYIVCEYRESKRSRALDLSNAGSGTLQVALLLAFLYARPAAVILLDEPDAHQHIILQKHVYELIRKVASAQGGQLIIATHSEVVLDATAPERVVGFFGGAPRVLAHKDERNQLREALKRVTTTEMMLGKELGAVLYVEGETDESILKEWARILEHPARKFFDRPFVHWLRGRSVREANDHFFALKAVHPDLRGFCLLDGDNRDEPDKEVTRAGLETRRWRRYEIENYLLLPDAVERFVNLPLMRGIVRQEFERQIPQGTDPFGDHVSLTRVKASSEFLLPMLSKAEMSTPKRDLYLLAAQMRADEIHPEVRDMLDDIARCLNSS